MPVPVESELTGSTDGLPIPIVAIATPGTTLHTAGATGYEKVWLWVSNLTAASALLTVEWGGVSDPANLLVKDFSVKANSLAIPVASGFIIKNSLLIRAFSPTTVALNIHGYVIAVR